MAPRCTSPLTATFFAFGSGSVIVVLMGVAGSGKTTVGTRLGKRLGWTFVDADDLHPESNVRKMAVGAPLTDKDRLPWLRSVREVMDGHTDSGRPAVLACSALKSGYRRILLEGQADARLVYLRASPAVLERRLRERRGHFFDPSLLASQLETLEEPSDAVIVDADREIEAVVHAVAAALGVF